MRISAIEAAPLHVLPFAASPSPNSARSALPFFRAFVDELPDSLDAILATADLQGFVDVGGTSIGLGEALPQVLEQLRSDGRLPAPERTAAILAGDLHGRADEDDVLPVWLGIERACRWVAGVAGNHDRIGALASRAAAQDALRGTRAHCLDGSTVTLDGIRVGGLCGTIGPGAGTWLRCEEQYNNVLTSMLGERCDLLVLHDGPNVAGTNLPGWPSIRKALEAAPPVLLVRGHDHWPDQVHELSNGTQVLNVEGRVVVLQRRSGDPPGGGIRAADRTATREA